ncbi:MAG: XdhC/CoxI family protein [PVC group bacterium]
MNTDVFSFILDSRRSGEAVVLATVVGSRGSVPAAAGSRMAVTASATAGTVGGGALEARVIEEARKALTDRKSWLLHFSLDDSEAADLGMICGGEQEVFLDVIEPSPRLLIFGGGHVGRALARVAAAAGFPVSVVDDRDEFVDPAHFPAGCSLIRMPFDGNWEGLGISAETMIVILTRGHAFDRLCLKKAVSTAARYIGMIGSRRKVAETLAALEKDGIPVKDDERVYAPVGLDLGGSSPEEIAVSILAEIVAVRYGGTGRHLREPVKNF